MTFTLKGALCEVWKFPKSFSFVTGSHHNPEELPEGSRTLATIVFVADRITAELGYGFRTDVKTTEIPGTILTELGMTTEQITKIKDAMPNAYEEVEATFC